MMNGRQRGHRLSDIIADVQHHMSRTKNAPETSIIQRALDALYDARRKAHEDTSDESPSSSRES